MILVYRGRNECYTAALTTEGGDLSALGQAIADHLHAQSDGGEQFWREVAGERQTEIMRQDRMISEQQRLIDYARERLAPIAEVAGKRG